MRAPPTKFSTKRGHRLHRQELRRARAHRKSHRADTLGPAQPVAQLRSPFPFAPPTAPTIPLTAPRGVFMFGATVMSSGIDSSPALLTTPPLSSLTSSELSSSSSSLSKLEVKSFQTQRLSMARHPQGMRALQRSAKSSIDPRSHGRGKCDRPKVTSQSDRTEPKRGRSSTCSRETFTEPVPVLLALTFPMDDSSMEDSDQASAASTVPLLITLLSFLRSLRPDLPRHRRRKVRDCTSSWQLPQFSTTDADFGKHLRHPRALSLRCTRAHMKALGRSRWLNGLCRCLHSGCTNGTGPRPSIEP